MTVVTLTPNGTNSNTGAVTGAGGDLDAALSDGSDATYVTLDEGETFNVGFSNLTLPAGALIKRVGLQGRLKASGTLGGWPQILASLYVNESPTPIPIENYPVINWLTPTTITFGSLDSADFTDTGVDGATGGIIVYQNATASVAVAVYEFSVLVTYVEVPALTVDSPAGTIVDAQPNIAWTNDYDSDGGDQTHAEVKIFTDAVYGAGGFDPDTSSAVHHAGPSASSGTSYDIGVEGGLLGDDTYRAYVRTAQTVNGIQHWSDWAYTTFTVDVDSPGDPTVVLTAQDSDGRMKLEISDTAGAATTDYFEVQRSDDGEVTWEAVRTLLDGALVEADGSGDATIYDREAPNGVDVSYRVRALHDYGLGAYGISSWTEVTGQWSSQSWWLRHPTDPTLDVEALPMRTTSAPGYSRAKRQTALQPLGASTPVVISDTPASKTGTLVIRTDSEDERVAMETLLATSSPVLIRAPDSEAFESRWASIGDHDYALLIDKAWMDSGNFTLPWTEVSRPSGNLEAWPAA